MRKELKKKKGSEQIHSSSAKGVSQGVSHLPTLGGSAQRWPLPFSDAGGTWLCLPAEVSEPSEPARWTAGSPLLTGQPPATTAAGHKHSSALLRPPPSSLPAAWTQAILTRQPRVSAMAWNPGELLTPHGAQPLTCHWPQGRGWEHCWALRAEISAEVPSAPGRGFLSASWPAPRLCAAPGPPEGFCGPLTSWPLPAPRPHRLSLQSPRLEGRTGGQTWGRSCR